MIVFFIIFRTNPGNTEEIITKGINVEQWGLNNIGQDIKGSEGIEDYDINALEAWEVTKGDKKTIIGILDTGLEVSNTAINTSIFKNENEIEGNEKDDDGNGYIDDVFGWDFINNDSSVYDDMTSDYHGTFIASLIAGEHSDTNEVWGVAPNVSILPLKFMTSSSGSMDSAIEAIEYGYNQGVRIFNMSWDTTVYDEDLFRTMEKYHDVLFITSSGKGKINVEKNPVYPCNFDLDNLVCVSAVDNVGELEEFSGYGLTLVSAPGVNVYGVLPEGENSFSNGTSFATAYVTGISALAKSAYPNIQSNELAKILKESKSTFNKESGTVEIIDAKQVLEKVKSIQ